MHLSEDHRHVGLQKGFSVLCTDTSSLSHRTKCEKEDVQRAAMTGIPHERPRPGRRRRLSTHHLPLSLTRFCLFLTMVFSVLCKPIEAVEHPGSQSRAVKGHFVDGGIIFDQISVPQPAMHRRENWESTEAASTTTAAEASQTSNSDSSTTTVSLPRAFDGGFGTNYTQPSCPTFLRSMVNNDTFISCVPFSLLLQVCPSHRKNLPLRNLPLKRLISPFPELHVFL